MNKPFKQITEIPPGLTIPNGIPDDSWLFALAHDSCTDKEWDKNKYPDENTVREYLEAIDAPFSIVGLVRDHHRTCLIAILREKIDPPPDAA